MDTVETLYIEGHAPLKWTFKALRDSLLPATGLRKVVLSGGATADFLEWLEALVPDGVCHCPTLHTIHLCDPPKTTHHALLFVLQMREECEHPVNTVRIGHYVDEGGEERGADDYRWWKDEGHVDLRPFVGELVFVENEPLPRMDPVPICSTPSTGAWKWPLWEDVY